jgi:glycosyltransferase involved in cell wall biosynthesis
VAFQPACSVIMAVRNEERHLSEALRSILNQDGVNLEVILVDDNSEDSTLSIAQTMAQLDERLTVLQNPGRGKVSAFNYGVACSDSDYVALFAGDDIMPPGSLHARVAAVESAGQSRPVFGLAKVRTLSERSRFDGVVVPKTPGVGNPSGQSTLLNRSAVGRVFPVPETLPNEDTWIGLAVRLLPEADVIHSDVVACDWRIHAGNTSPTHLTGNQQEFSSRLAARMRALESFRDQFASELADTDLRYLENAIHCEHMRQQGSVAGVLRSQIPMQERLRALSSTNAFFFGVRRFLFSILSGR